MEAVSVFCGVADLWRPPRTPSLREGVFLDVGVSACGGCGSGDDERNMRPFLPPASLPDGVEVFEDAGGDGEV